MEADYMTIKKTSWIIRCAYLFEDKLPKRTNVCTIIGRLLVLPILCVLAGILIIPLVLFAFPIIWLEEEFPKTQISKRLDKWWKNNFVYVAISDWKNKTCTIVEIE